jgi:hypothetical protein
MTMHTQFNEFEISIARYKRLAREVTDPLAVCLIEVVIGDLEAGREGGREKDSLSPSNGVTIRTGQEDRIGQPKLACVGGFLKWA